MKNVHTESQKSQKSSNMKARIRVIGNGIFIFSSKRFGVITSFPLMMLNGITTTVGLTKLLPLTIGIPVGVLLSTIYFFTVILTDVKKEHPLRRFLLICFLCLGSIYTSFFAIYDQLSEGQLEYQPAINTVSAHNQFIDDLRSSLRQLINRMERQNPDIGALNSLKEQLDKLDQERRQASEIDIRGRRAEEISALDNRIGELQSIESSYEYQLHSSLARILERNEFSNDSYLTLESFIESNQSYSGLFARDNSLFRDVTIAIESLQDFNSNLTTENLLQPPNYDDYVKTPTFLVPMEIFLHPNSERQINFILFAIIASVFLEMIPLLLGGILTEYNGKNNSKKQSKTILGQVSHATTKLIGNINETIFEIWSSLTTPIELTENTRKNFENKLDQSMSAFEFNKNEKKEFLVRFYQSIERPKQNIILTDKGYLSEEEDIFNDTNSSNKQKFCIATALIIDVMQDTTVRWLAKTDAAGHYEFLSSKKYEYFMTWLLQELNESESDQSSDKANSDLEIRVEYTTQGSSDYSNPV